MYLFEENLPCRFKVFSLYKMIRNESRIFVFKNKSAGSKYSNKIILKLSQKHFVVTGRLMLLRNFFTIGSK